MNRSEVGIYARTDFDVIPELIEFGDDGSLFYLNVWFLRPLKPPSLQFWISDILMFNFSSSKCIRENTVFSLIVNYLDYMGYTGIVVKIRFYRKSVNI